jgi:hypothetical protein
LPSLRPAAGLLALALAGLCALVPAASAAAPANVLTCGASGSDVFTTLSAAPVTVRSCSLTAPRDGTLVVLATASAGLDAPGPDAGFELAARLGVDDPAGSAATERRLDVVPDPPPGDGTDRALASSGAFAVSAGRHVVTLAVRRSNGNGVVRLYSPQLSVLFVPGSSSQASVCSDGADDSFTTTSSALGTVRSCRIDLPVDADVLLVASASADSAPGDAYELRTSLGADGAAITGTERRLDVGDDGPAPEADLNAFSSALVPLAAGRHDVSLLAGRSAGRDRVALDDAQLVAVAVPRSGSRLVACGSGGQGTFSTSSGPLALVRSCTAGAPAGATALVVGSASVGLGPGGAGELRARLGVDSATGTAASDRWVDVYPDGSDGTDEALALSALTGVAAGAHTFSLVADRYAGAGAVRLDSSQLAALVVPPPDLTAPVVSLTSAPAAATTDTGATLAFTADDPDATFACRLDGGTFAACGSPVRLTGLAVGAHAFSVRATDAVGNVSATTTASWQVTVAAPAAPAPAPAGAPAPAAVPGPVVITTAPSRSPARARVVSARYERRTGRIVLRVALGGAGKVTAKATARLRGHTRTIGSRSGRASRERTVTLVLHASKSARRHTRLRARLRIVVRPVIGERQTLSRTMVLRRPAAKR